MGAPQATARSIRWRPSLGLVAARWLLWLERARPRGRPPFRRMHDELVAEIAYMETVRRLSNQLSVLEQIRSRTGTLFSAAVLATSFLSGAVEGKNLRIGEWGVAALVSFAAAAAISALMLMPRDMRFSLQWRDVRDLREGEMQGSPTGSRAETYRKLTRRLERRSSMNWRRMKWMFRGMRVLPYLVAAELLFWASDFSSRDFAGFCGIGLLALGAAFVLHDLVWGSRSDEPEDRSPDAADVEAETSFN
jgi:hypothetical protein